MVNISALRGRVAAVVMSFGLMSAPVCAGEVRVAVASNFFVPSERIVALFQQESRHIVKLSAGASGKLYAQIKSGAAFDVFLSADEELPKRLLQDGLVVGGTRFVYGSGRLVLWSAQSDFVDDKGKVLGKGNFEQLAIPNPRLSPYGVAAQETLTKLTMWNAMQRKLVKGEDAAQTYRIAETERADLAFIPLSLVMRDGKVTQGSYWLVPPEMHQPIRQSAVLLNGAQDQAAAKAFLAFLRSEKAKAEMRAFGYEFP